MGKYYSFRNSFYDQELKCKNVNLDRKININKLFNSKIKKNFNNFKKNHIFVTRKNKSINDLLDLMQIKLRLNIVYNENKLQL